MCGVVISRAHQRTTQGVRDFPFDGPVTVWWVKKRWRCAEPLCDRATYTEHTVQVPPYARLTVRLKDRIVAALAGEVRCVQAVAAELGVAWPTEVPPKSWKVPYAASGWRAVVVSNETGDIIAAEL